MRPRPILLSIVLLAWTAPALADCAPPGWNVESLKGLKANAFAIEDGAARMQLANALLDCLADPDPAVRDGIAYEAWTTWLRGSKLDEATRRAALLRLQAAIAPERGDEAGFAQPFAALVLSELARSDRKLAWLQPDERAALVEAAARYLESVRDYRGFVAGEGWRHGVAHGADLAMQLALNPALDKAQLDRLLAAVATQVSPSGQAYVFGEPERLARPVVFAAGRGLHTEAEWKAWLAKVAEAPAGGWQGAFNDAAGLVRRHNLRAFLLALHLQVRDSELTGTKTLVPALIEQLRAVP